jgi:hypothetical protein
MAPPSAVVPESVELPFPPAPVPVPFAQAAEPAAAIFPAPLPSVAPPDTADMPAYPPASERSAHVDVFAHHPPFRPRRNPTRRWALAAIGAGALMIAGIGAIQLFGTPSLLAKIGISRGPIDVPLLFQVPRKPVRRTLENGNELFAITGNIVNPTSTRQRIPDILAELRNAQGNIVYVWTIIPPKRTVAPKASLEFNSAEVNVPKGAIKLNLSFSGAGGG